MDEAVIAHLAREMLWLVLLLSLPAVLVASLVGVIVSLIQALTQIQDQTVQLLFKLIAVALTLVASYHWMGQTILTYTTEAFNQISRMGP